MNIEDIKINKTTEDNKSKEVKKNNKLDNLKNKSRWGGKRKGAGKPKGAKNKATLEQEIVKEEFRQRVLKSMQQLINAQMNIAQGCQMLFKIKKNAKGGKGKNKPELVTNQEEIEEYLAGDYDENEHDFYFMTTAKPDNKALDSLIDRVFGKSTQVLGGDKDNPINIKYDWGEYKDNKTI